MKVPLLVVRIEDLRRTHKWTARRRDIDPTGASNRTIRRIVARFPSHTVHLDVKKVGTHP